MKKIQKIGIVTLVLAVAVTFGLTIQAGDSNETVKEQSNQAVSVEKAAAQADAGKTCSGDKASVKTAAAEGKTCDKTKNASVKTAAVTADGKDCSDKAGTVKTAAVQDKSCDKTKNASVKTAEMTSGESGTCADKAGAKTAAAHGEDCEGQCCDGDKTRTTTADKQSKDAEEDEEVTAQVID